MLRQVVLTRKLAELNKALEEARDKDAGFLQRKEALALREAELEAALNEVSEETPEEDKAAVEAEISQHGEDQDALAADEAENNAETQRLSEQIAGLQKELDELNARAAKPPVPPIREERKDEIITMENRMKFFRGMAPERRDTIIARQEVKDFIQRVREMKGQTRAVTGGDLNIPDVLLGVLRDNLHTYSKLLKYVRLVRVPGKSRQNIAGTIPEGVWTEACAKINELAISFNQIEVDGYKVGGFIPVCNALLEDSDVNLADEVMYMIGQAIGLAIDKAIVYGTGTKMPVGIVTRLAEEAEPAYWGDNEAAWTDLHTSNIKKINPASMTPEAFYSALILALGAVKGNYSNGNRFAVMNSKTFASLQAKALGFSATGAIVSGQTGTVPIIGGDIVILEFIPDNDIVYGFGDLYLLAERAGAQFAVSEHYRFVEDQTVFKGTARYDGRPVIGEGFVAVNINNTDLTTTAVFASDTANP
ncbi:MAG: phage major capsid protein [Clostridiales bacterium]|nr:phage major capsid protein [Clostridiales bacterium]